jgi:hypothetical protein
MFTRRNGPARGRWQFSMRTLVLLPVVSALLMAGVLQYPDTMALGIGFKSITLQFDVVDSATLSPVPGAVVTLYEAEDPSGSRTERAGTSNSGNAAFTRDFPFYYSSGRRQGTKAIVHLDSLCFEVSAPGYRPARFWLAQYTGPAHDLECSDLAPRIQVKLERIDTRYQMFSAALETIQPNFPPGILQGDPRFTHAYFNMSSSANARGPWNEGQGPWGRGEGWEYIDDPLRRVVETQGQLRKAVVGTAQTPDQAQQNARTLGQQRSREVKAAVPTGPNQWSSYPQSNLASPKVAQDGQGR